MVLRRSECSTIADILPSYTGVSVRTRADFSAVVVGIKNSLISPLKLSGKEETIALEPGYIFVYNETKRWSDGLKWGSGRMSTKGKYAKIVRYSERSGNFRKYSGVEGEWRIVYYGVDKDDDPLPPAEKHHMFRRRDSSRQVLSEVPSAEKVPPIQCRRYPVRQDDGQAHFEQPIEDVDIIRCGIRAFESHSMLQSFTPSGNGDSARITGEVGSRHGTDLCRSILGTMSNQNCSFAYDSSILPNPGEQTSTWISHTGMNSTELNHQDNFHFNNNDHDAVDGHSSTEAYAKTDPRAWTTGLPYVDTTESDNPDRNLIAGIFPEDRQSSLESMLHLAPSQSTETNLPLVVHNNSGVSSVASGYHETYHNHNGSTSLFLDWCQLLDRPISPRIADPLEPAWSLFYLRLVQRHSAALACHAAMEVFVVENQSVTLLAVLREDLDAQPNFDPTRDPSVDFRTHALIQPLPGGSSPVSWLQLQASAGSVSNARMKSALWTLAALPRASHAPQSETFRWLKQTRLAIASRRGIINVMSVSSGEDTMPLPRTHELRGRLTHPANVGIRSEVLLSIDDEYKAAIEDDCEDWLISLFGQLAHLPDELREPTLFANLQYMFKTLKLEAEAFEKAGHTTCPHAKNSPSSPCAYMQTTFETNALDMKDLCTELMKNVMKKRTWMGVPSVEQRRISRKMGRLHHKCRHAYGILSDSEYDQYHSVTFPGLTRLRPLLSAQPVGIIWNYVAPDMKARAASIRLQSPAE